MWRAGTTTAAFKRTYTLVDLLGVIGLQLDVAILVHKWIPVQLSAFGQDLPPSCYLDLAHVPKPTVATTVDRRRQKPAGHAINAVE